jgi:hypothetical protein
VRLIRADIKELYKTQGKSEKQVLVKLCWVRGETVKEVGEKRVDKKTGKEQLVLLSSSGVLYLHDAGPQDHNCGREK